MMEGPIDDNEIREAAFDLGPSKPRDLMGFKLSSIMNFGEILGQLLAKW